jgi:hypothetical protein
MRKLFAAIVIALLSIFVLPGGARAEWHGQPGSKAYREHQRRAGSPAHQASVQASQRIWNERNNLGAYGFQAKYGTSNVGSVASRVGYSAFMQTLCAGLRR